MRRLARGLTASLVLLGVTLPAGQSYASQASSGGYTPPPFACHVYQFGEGEKPPWWLWLIDPLCVEYSKRDITLDNGGALRFMLAEPARIAVATPVCRYWQQDHWSVQTTPGATALVAWDGSYWFDKPARRAAIRLTNFRVDGQTVGIGDAVVALRPGFPEVAEALAIYGSTYGETGIAADLPYSVWCALNLGDPLARSR